MLASVSHPGIITVFRVKVSLGPRRVYTALESVIFLLVVSHALSADCAFYSDGCFLNVEAEIHSEMRAIVDLWRFIFYVFILV